MPTVAYPGSFDPLHLGHLDIVEQAAELFGRVVVVVMHNREKPSGLFDVDERIRLVRASVAQLDGLGQQVDVGSHSGLAVDAAREAGADFIVKGLRTAADFEIEQQMALTNHSVTGMRTVFVPCRPEFGYISSRFIREIAAQGGRIGHMVPGPVGAALADRFDLSP